MQPYSLHKSMYSLHIWHVINNFIVTIVRWKRCWAADIYGSERRCHGTLLYINIQWRALTVSSPQVTSGAIHQFCCRPQAQEVTTMRAYKDPSVSSLLPEKNYFFIGRLPGAMGAQGSRWGWKGTPVSSVLYIFVCSWSRQTQHLLPVTVNHKPWTMTWRTLPVNGQLK